MFTQSTIESNDEDIQFINKDDYIQSKDDQHKPQNIYIFNTPSRIQTKQQKNQQFLIQNQVITADKNMKDDKYINENKQIKKDKKLIQNKNKKDDKKGNRNKKMQGNMQGKEEEINQLDQLLLRVKSQLSGQTFKTRDDYKIVSLYQNIQFNDAEHMFADVHLEFNLKFIDGFIRYTSNSECEMGTMDCEYNAGVERFTKFQFWRPCMYSEHCKQEKLVKYQIVPNIYNRTSDYSRFIQHYKKMSHDLVQDWARQIEHFQSITQTMKSQMRMFFQQIKQSEDMKIYFNSLKEQFHQQAQDEIKQLSKQNKYFVYYLGDTNSDTCDFQIESYGVSEDFIDLLGPNREDTAQCIMKYGLPFFMTQFTRIYRYMNDLSFLLTGARKKERQEFITLDEYKLTSQMTPVIYEMKFTEEQHQSMSQEMIMLLRIIMHFRVDTYSFEPNMLLQLQTKRKQDKESQLSLEQEYQYFCTNLIFNNQLIDKFYSESSS